MMYFFTQKPSERLRHPQQTIKIQHFEERPIPPDDYPFYRIKRCGFCLWRAPILSNVNFQIAQGNFAAIMGGSGSGKTTLMRLITGQLRRSRGRCW